MTYRVIALLFLLVFYGIYFIKMLLQRRKGIVTDQIAKGKVRDKGFYIEFIMKIATMLVPLTEVLSIVLGVAMLPIMYRVIGMYFAFIGDIVFFASVYTMRDSWRAGVAADDEKERKLVTNGIYNYSRNPAFLGFDLVYAGILLMFFNPVLLAVSVFAMVMLHMQILREEEFLTSFLEMIIQNTRKEQADTRAWVKLRYPKLFCISILFSEYGLFCIFLPVFHTAEVFHFRGCGYGF